MKKIVSIIILSVFINSCIKIDLFEKQSQIPSQQWYYSNVPQFTFNIQDTSSHYNVYIVLRHTDLYEYNNIWLRIGSASPSDTTHYQNINLKLGTDSKGWLGSGMDDIFELRKNISPGPVSFKKPGDYTFSVAQIMRDNPLKYILDVGIRVEKLSM
ncbi:MAG: gliding motility lipoprotein GldH [Ginsengibacter sp.]